MSAFSLYRSSSRRSGLGAIVAFCSITLALLVVKDSPLASGASSPSQQEETQKREDAELLRQAAVFAAAEEDDRYLVEYFDHKCEAEFPPLRLMKGDEASTTTGTIYYYEDVKSVPLRECEATLSAWEQQCEEAAVQSGDGFLSVVVTTNDKRKESQQKKAHHCRRCTESVDGKVWQIYPRQGKVNYTLYKLNGEEQPWPYSSDWRGYRLMENNRMEFLHYLPSIDTCCRATHVTQKAQRPKKEGPFALQCTTGSFAGRHPYYPVSHSYARELFAKCMKACKSSEGAIYSGGCGLTYESCFGLTGRVVYEEVPGGLKTSMWDMSCLRRGNFFDVKFKKEEVITMEVEDDLLLTCYLDGPWLTGKKPPRDEKLVVYQRNVNDSEGKNAASSAISANQWQYMAVAMALSLISSLALLSQSPPWYN